MQIKMRAVLTQLELEEAVRLFVRQELPAADGQNISVSFEDDKEGNLTALVDIDSAGGEIPSQKPKTTRKKGVAGSAGAAESASETKPADTTGEQTTAAADDPSPPWNEGKEAETQKAEEPAEEPVKEEVKTQPNEIPATNKIFPDADSSAAPSAVPPKPDTAAAAKSLFANLTKPTQ